MPKAANKQRAAQWLEAGDHAIQAKDPSRALLAYLSAWPEASSEQLADSIVAAGACDPDPAAWSKPATFDDPRRRTPLLATVVTNTPAAVAADRVATIAQWPPDPRVDRAIIEWLETVPYRATSTMVFWTQVFRRAHQIRDPSVLPRLRALPALYARTIMTTTGRALAAKVEALIAELAPRFEAYGDLPVPAATAFKPSAPTADEAMLLAQIYAHPEDDAARMVYADVLSARGDPRGELIALQLLAKPTKPQQARIAELIAIHRGVLLGPIAPFALTKQVVFARGFLSSCALKSKPLANVAEFDAIAGHLLWSTVEHVEGPSVIFLHPVMRALRSVVAGVTPTDELFAGPVERPLRFVSVYASAFGTRVREERTPEQLTRIAGCPALPRLEHLELREARDTLSFGRVLAGVGARVQQISAVDCGRGINGVAGAEWMRALFAAPARPPRVRLQFGDAYRPTDATLHFDPTRTHVVAIDMAYTRPQDQGQADWFGGELAAILDAIDPANVTHLHVKATGKDERVPVDVLTHALARFGDVRDLKT